MYMRIEKQKLQMVIEAFKPMADEVKLEFKPDGIHIRSCDKAHISLLSVVLKKEAFDEYNPEDLVIAVDLFKIREYLRLYKKGDHISFEYDQDNNRLVAKNGCLTRTFGLIDPDGLLDPKIPVLSLSKKVAVNTDVLLKNIKGLIPEKKYVEPVQLWVTSEGLCLSYTDDDQNNVAVISKDQLLSFTPGDTKESCYDCDYLLPILKEFKKLFSEIILEFDHNTPMHLCSDNKDIMAQYWLAPRIEEDEIEEQILIPEDQSAEVKSKPEIKEPPTDMPEDIAQEIPEPMDPIEPLIAEKWVKTDFESYAIYHNNKYPDIKIHFARIKAHESYGYKYAVYLSGYPCATFVGGANRLKEAIEIAQKKPEPIPEGHATAVKPEPEISEAIVKPVPPEVSSEEPISVVKPGINTEKLPSDMIGCLVVIKTKTRIIGEVTEVTETGYMVLFKGMKSKTLKEPVEIDRDLVEVYQREEGK